MGTRFIIANVIARGYTGNSRITIILYSPPAEGGEDTTLQARAISLRGAEYRLTALETRVGQRGFKRLEGSGK